MGIFLLWATWAHEYIFFSKFIGIARRGDLKELEVCDFDKILRIFDGHVFL